jgi:hypothetical protein
MQSSTVSIVVKSPLAFRRDCSIDTNVLRIRASYLNCNVFGSVAKRSLDHERSNKIQHEKHAPFHPPTNALPMSHVSCKPVMNIEHLLHEPTVLEWWPTLFLQSHHRENLRNRCDTGTVHSRRVVQCECRSTLNNDWKTGQSSSSVWPGGKSRCQCPNLCEKFP